MVFSDLYLSHAKTSSVFSGVRGGMSAGGESSGHAGKDVLQ